MKKLITHTKWIHSFYVLTHKLKNTLSTVFLLIVLFISGNSIGQTTFIDEDFNGTTGTTPPSGWTNNEILANGGLWNFDNPGSRTLNTPITDPAAIFDSDDLGLDGNAEETALESPQFDASTADGSVILEFDHYFNGGFGGEYNVEVYNGSSWVNILSGTTDTNNPQLESIDITADLNGATNAQVRFRWVGDYSFYWIVDNVSVVDKTCLEPTNLATSNITTTTADLSWDAEATATSGYDWVIVADGDDPDVGPFIDSANGVMGTSVSASGLSAGTDYDAYVRSDCGGGDKSDWSGAEDFSTLANGDVCSDAFSLTVTSDDTNTTSLSTSNANGSTLENNLDCDSFGTNYGLWYSFTSPSETLEFETIAGSPEITIFEGSDCNNLTEVTSGCLTGTGTITGLTSGNDYYALVWTDSQTANVEFSLYYISCPAPTNLANTATTAATADFSWDAVGFATNGYEYVVMPSGDAPDTGNAVDTGSVASGTTSVQATGLGDDTAYDFYVRSNCGGGDESDWSAAESFTTACATEALPWSEDFENAGSTPDCWTESGGESWDYDNSGTGNVGDGGTLTGSTDSGNYFAWIDNSGSQGPSTLTSPFVDLSSLTTPQVAFYVISDSGSDPNATLDVEVYDGSSWNNVGSFSSDTNGWERKEIVLSSLTFTGDAQVRFTITDNGGFRDDIAIDDITFEEAPACPAPGNVSNDALTSTTADFSWDASFNESGGYAVRVMNPGDDPISGSPVATDAVGSGVTSVTITTLSSNTSYDFYVQAFCGSSGTSSFAGPLSFTTPLLEASPWSENFDVAGQDGWQTSGFEFGNESSRNVEGRDGSDVINENLWSSVTNASFETVRVGPVQTGDYLSYEYKLSNFSSPHGSPAAGACDFTVDITGSTSGTVEEQSFTNDGKLGWHKNYVDLSAYVGEEIYITVDATRNSGDFYLFFDNFAIENVNGFVYANDTDQWLTGMPNTATATDDIEVIEGTASFTADVEANNLSIFVQASLDVEDVLDLSGDLYSDGQVTFKSTSTKTAQLASANSIIGDVTVERFIPVQTEDTRAFRFLTSAVDSNDPIFDNWQEGGNSPAGFGTHITGSTTGDNGFDQSVSGNPSMYTFDNSFTGNQDNAWNPIPDTDNTNLVAGEAYRIFIRGDRNYDLDSDPANAPNSDVTLRATGSLTIGNKTETLSDVANYYSLVGNPYQAVVDFNNLTTTNVNTSNYFVWDPNMNTRGAYVTHNLTTGTNNLVSSATNEFIMPGQSFFVQTTNSAAASLEFTEASKDVTAGQTTVFNDDMDPSFMNLLLYKDQDLNNGGSESDGVLMIFSQNGNDAVDQNDAGKLGNPDENLARSIGGQYLSVDDRSLPSDTENLELYTTGYSVTDYTFSLNVNNLGDEVDVYLIDNHTGDQTLMNGDSNQYSFTVDPSIPSSVAVDRFSIQFEIETFGIDDNENLANFKVYPNPVTDGELTIIASQMAGDDVELNLYNMIGQSILETEGRFESNGEMKLNLGSYQAGVYFLEINNKGETARERLIIK